jgi:hypothetical protein
MGTVAILATATSAVLAQAPPPGGPRPFGGAVGGMMGGVVIGTIRQVDPARNVIQVQALGPEGGQERWITVSPQTAIMVQGSGTLAELKPNDTIVVSGMPTAITAAQIQIGELPPPPLMGMRGGAGGFPGGGPPPPPAPGGAPPARLGEGRPPGVGNLPPGGAGPRGMGMMGGAPMSRVTGTVVTTKPLVVALPGDLKVTVAAEPNTRVTKVSRATLADLKVGDMIRAFGQPNPDGNLVASQITAGVEMGPGLGGFGGGFPVPGTVVPLQPRPGTNF